MIRLPRFEYQAPATVEEAAARLADAGSEAMLLAGGTDLLPNMKRRQQTPRVLIALRRIAGLHLHTNGNGHTIGAGLTLSAIVRDTRLQQDCTALWQAAAQIATPHLRNMGTIGGNLCLDTRCTYYDQNEEWRQAISYCMKAEGKVCWVAPSSPRCWAVQSADSAPMLVALGARVRLDSASGEREIPVEALYRDDGME